MVFLARVYYQTGYVDRLRSLRELIDFLERAAVTGRTDFSVTFKDPRYVGYYSIHPTPGNPFGKWIVTGSDHDPEVAGELGIVNPGWHVGDFKDLTEVIKWLKGETDE